MKLTASETCRRCGGAIAIDPAIAERAEREDWRRATTVFTCDAGVGYNTPDGVTFICAPCCAVAYSNTGDPQLAQFARNESS
jgi:hypothetical protein